MSRVTLEEVEALAAQLTSTEQRMLLERLERRLREAAAARVPQNLYGVWRGRVPDDVDIDEVLREVRTEWEKEWSDDGQFIE